MRKIKDALEKLAQQGVVTVFGHGEDGGAVQLVKSQWHPTTYKIIFSWGLNWDHVSVTACDHDEGDRIPTWGEMEMIKRAFFKDNETVMQLHVPPSDHINCHPYCLHLWRPQRVKIPRPPSNMVA